MSNTQLIVRSDPEDTPGLRRLAFECPHGATSALLLPGARSVTDLTLLDILLARHQGARGCSCAPDPHHAQVAPARA